jgi:hypothetical protein
MAEFESFHLKFCHKDAERGRGAGGKQGKRFGRWDLAFEEPWFCCFEERKRNEGKTDRAFRGFEGKVIPAAFRRRKPPVFIRAPFGTF